MKNTESSSHAVLERPAQPPVSRPSPVEQKRSGSLPLILTIVAGLAVGGYFVMRPSQTEKTEESKEAEVSGVQVVHVVHPKPDSVIAEIALPGSTQSFTDTPIYARTNGYLKSWFFDIGAHVKKGDLLAEIDTPEVDRQLEQARAEVENAKANLDLSQITAKRSVQLLKSSTISHQEADQASSDLSSKTALLESAKANVRRLEKLQSFEKVYAPFAGVITTRSTDVGALIQSGDTSNAKELFHMVDTHILRVYISVPEVYTSAARTGEKVEVTLDSLPNEKFTGTLVRNSEAIDPQSRTLNAEADIENPDGRLLPGAYASVRLKVASSSGAVTIPANTLLFRSEGLQVGVARDGKVKLVPVTIGQDMGNTVEVVAGLTTKDALILDPSDSLTDGAPVQVEETPEK